jgi:hypothetical protein
MDSFKSAAIAENATTNAFSDEVWGTHQRQFSLEQSGSASYVVKPGDNAWNIAADLTRELNKQFPDHASTNAEILAMLKSLQSYNRENIGDLSKIYPGDVIKIPPDIRGAIELSKRSDSNEEESTMADKQIQSNDEIDSTSSGVWQGIDRASAVTHADMRDFFSRNYTQLDSDKDGFVTDKELLSMLKDDDLSPEDKAVGEAVHKVFDQVAALNNDNEHFWQGSKISTFDMGKASRLDEDSDQDGLIAQIDQEIQASALRQKANASAADFDALDRDGSQSLSQNELIEDLTDRGLSRGERQSALFLSDNFDAILGHAAQTAKGEIKLPDIELYGNE